MKGCLKSVRNVLLLLGTTAFVVSPCCNAFVAAPRRMGKQSQVTPQTPFTTGTTTALAVSPDITESVTNAWKSYNEALEANPLLMKSVTASIILGAADLTGQILEKTGNPVSTKQPQDNTAVDWARVARFAIFGLVLQAPWNHFYYLLLDGALPPTPEPFTTTTGIKVVIDQFVQAPIFTVLIFAFLGTLEGKQLDQVKKQLDDDYVDTMLANWKLWVPATVVNIAFCPPVLRVLFLNVVFFFWSIFLSLKLNKDAVPVEQE